MDRPGGFPIKSQARWTIYVGAAACKALIPTVTFQPSKAGPRICRLKHEQPIFADNITEESLGYATLCVLDRVFPPHPGPLPQGEGTASVCLVFSRWLLGKLWHGCDRE